MQTQTEPILEEVLTLFNAALSGLEDQAKEAQKAINYTMAIGIIIGLIITVFLPFAILSVKE